MKYTGSFQLGYINLLLFFFKTVYFFCGQLWTDFIVHYSWKHGHHECVTKYNTLISICHPFPLTVDTVNVSFCVDSTVRVSQLVVRVCFGRVLLSKALCDSVNWKVVNSFEVLWKYKGLWGLVNPSALICFNCQVTKVKMWSTVYCQVFRFVSASS